MLKRTDIDIKQTDPVIKLQKKAVFCDSTNQLVYLFQSRTLKSFDIVYLKATKIMFPVQNKSLPDCLWLLFKLGEEN